MSNESCLVVKRSALEGLGLVAAPGASLFIPMDDGSWSRLDRLLNEQGTYRERRGADNVEQDESYKQIIPYLFVVASDGSFLIYQRNTDLSKYSESRLSGKVSLGIGGHVKSGETVADALFREFCEEAALSVDGEEVAFDLDSAESRARFSSLLNPACVGAIDDERDPVGRVHLGIAFEVLLPASHRVSMRNGESVRFEYVTAQEYASRAEGSGLLPEGWTDVVVRNVLARK